MLFYVPPDCQQRLRSRLKDLLWVPFRFDTGGSQIIFYSPQRDYSELDSLRFQSPDWVPLEAARAGEAVARMSPANP